MTGNQFIIIYWQLKYSCHAKARCFKQLVQTCTIKDVNEKEWPLVTSSKRFSSGSYSIWSAYLGNCTSRKSSMVGRKNCRFRNWLCIHWYRTCSVRQTSSFVDVQILFSLRYCPYSSCSQTRSLRSQQSRRCRSCWRDCSVHWNSWISQRAGKRCQIQASQGWSSVQRMFSWQTDGAKDERLFRSWKWGKDRRVEHWISKGARQSRCPPCGAWRRLYSHWPTWSLMQSRHSFRIRPS